LDLKFFLKLALYRTPYAALYSLKKVDKLSELYKYMEATMMQKIQWKGSHETVSAMCLGTMYFGSRVNKETSYRILDAYVEAGGNFLDTANNYAFWIDGCVGDESETLLGQYFADRGNRNEVFLATKLGARMVERADGSKGFEGVSPTVIQRAIDGSLKRLRVDHVDLLYIHVDDRETSLEDSLEALDRLVQHGKVRYIGISNVKAWRFSEAKMISKMKGLSSFTAVQNFYTYLRDRLDRDFTWLSPEFTDMAKTFNDFNLLAYGPLLKGAYARGKFQPWDDQAERFTTADSNARLERVNLLARELGVSVNQLVLAYVMHTDPVIIPVFGASTPEQLKDSLGALDITWTEGLAADLKNAGA
jgi:aryl-alcohol dehydrogenase-like predicted oxidoreductase